MERQSPSTSDAPSAITTPLLDPRLLRRVVVEAVAPEIDGGRFAIKRTPGEQVIVEADVYADGHDTLGAAVLWRRRGDERWNETAMTPLGNDRWRAAFAAIRNRAIGRQARRDETMQAVEDLVRNLVRHEPEGELGGGG